MVTAALYLIVSATGARKWVFRFTLTGRVTEMGLGSADAVSLSAARDAAREARKLLARNENPISAKRQAAALAAGTPTFAFVADAMIAARGCAASAKILQLLMASAAHFAIGPATRLISRVKLPRRRSRM
jgi:Arm DNA-binding domain